MSKYIKCDKGGCESIVDKAYIASGDIVELGGGGYVNTLSDIVKFDLCLSCYDEFKIWLKGDRNETL